MSKKGESMQEYKLTIATITDGKETQTIRVGGLEVNESALTIFYKEENAETTLTIESGKAEVVRRGDYGMQLFLKEKEIKKGILEIGAGKGEIETYTHGVKFSIKENKVMVTLVYDILFGKEKQEMQIRVLAIKK